MNPTVSSGTPTGLLTHEEYERLHGNDPCVELVEGKLVRCPMPGASHGYICGIAGYLLYSFVKDRGLGRVFTNDTFVRTKRNPDTTRGADVQFISYERLPRGPVPEGAPPVPPELVIEVRSPTDRISQLTAKASEYLDAGVSVVLVLDPQTESAAVFRADELPQRFSNGDELTLPDVLPGFSVPVRRFFE